VALLVITLVLLQDEGGEGLGGIFGGNEEQTLGSKQGNPLTRLTSILATIFIISALSLGWLLRSSDIDNVERVAEELERAENESGLEWWLSPEAAETDAEIDVDDERNLLEELLRQREEN